VPQCGDEVASIGMRGAMNIAGGPGNFVAFYLSRKDMNLSSKYAENRRA